MAGHIRSPGLGFDTCFLEPAGDGDDFEEDTEPLTAPQLS